MRLRGFDEAPKLSGKRVGISPQSRRDTEKVPKRRNAKREAASSFPRQQRGPRSQRMRLRGFDEAPKLSGKPAEISPQGRRDTEEDLRKGGTQSASPPRHFRGDRGGGGRRECAYGDLTKPRS
jgi:hypothetical protein